MAQAKLFSRFSHTLSPLSPESYHICSAPVSLWLPMCPGSDSKESAYNAGDPGSIPGLGRCPGGGNDNPLQYSCLDNPWTEEPGGLQSMGSQRVEHNWGDLPHMHPALSPKRLTSVSCINQAALPSGFWLDETAGHLWQELRGWAGREVGGCVSPAPSPFLLRSAGWDGFRGQGTLQGLGVIPSFWQCHLFPAQGLTATPPNHDPWAPISSVTIQLTLQAALQGNFLKLWNSH